MSLPEKQVITMHEFVPVEQLERSRFYTEYLVPWDAIYNLGVDLRDGDRLYARLRVTRGRAAGNFTASEKRFVESLVPHFDIAMRTHAALDATKMERAIYADAMDHLTLATVILDASGHVIHTNALARDILQRLTEHSLANDTPRAHKPGRCPAPARCDRPCGSLSGAPPSPASSMCCVPAARPAPVTTGS